jgi:hypothetical protein
MDVEGDFLAVCAPVLVAEAVGVFAVVLGGKGVVAVGDGLLVDFVLARGVCDLSKEVSVSLHCCLTLEFDKCRRCKVLLMWKDVKCHPRCVWHGK